MNEYHPAASVHSWAIRFVASQEGVMMVLSDMITMEQLIDDTSYMADFKPLSKEEYKILGRFIDILNENTPFPARLASTVRKTARRTSRFRITLHS